MKFQPGKSGNPLGKKPGTLHRRTQLNKLFEAHAPALINKCVELALAGDSNALRLAIERLVPRAKDVPVPFHLPEELTVESLPPMIETIMRSLEAGEITPDQARSLLDVMRGYRDYVVVEKLLQKYMALKERCDQNYSASLLVGTQDMLKHQGDKSNDKK